MKRLRKGATVLYRILVVDDESSVIEGLDATIPWSELQISTVFRAYSGFEALDILNNQSGAVDIVLTDIRMPGMSGIELIKHIYEHSLSSKCILLTGFSDFEYAQEAIRTGTFDYLLKPASDDEIIAAILRSIEAIRREWDQAALQLKNTKLMKQQLPLLRQNLLADLLKGRQLSHSLIESRLECCEIPFVIGDHITVMLLLLEDDKDGDYASKSLVYYAICNIAEELLGADYRIWSGTDDYDNLVLVIKPGSQLEKMANALQKAVNVYLNRSLTIAVSKDGTFPRSFYHQHRRLLTLFRQRLGREQEILFAPTEENQPDNHPESYELTSILKLLDAGQWTLLDEKLDDVFQSLSGQHEEKALEVYFGISNALTQYAMKNELRLSDMLGSDYDRLKSFDSFRSIREFRDWVIHAVHRIHQCSAQEAHTNRSRIVRQIQSYIKGNLKSDLSMQTVGDVVSLHPVYLSKMYKEDTGEGLSDYIYRLRMERAAELLVQTNKKIQDIAYEAGYYNASYFIQVFKRYYLVTPQEYRNTRLLR